MRWMELFDVADMVFFPVAFSSSTVVGCASRLGLEPDDLMEMRCIAVVTGDEE